MRHLLRGTAAASALLLALSTAGTAHAAGFQLKEQSSEGLGHAFAGMTAKATDYDTIFYNPAGMTRLETGMSGNLSYIAPVADFSNNGSSVTGTASALGNASGGDAISDAVLPSLYAMWKVNPDLALGISTNVPYGLTTDYDSNWIGRYHALKSDLRTISIQPAVAYRVVPKLSLGAGVNVQYASAELTKAVDSAAINTAVLGAGLINFGPGVVTSNGVATDGLSKVEGDDLAVGFTLSALYEVSEDTRLGVHYRSRVHHTLEGDLTISNKPIFATANPVAQAALVGPANAQLANGTASAKLTTPDSANIGLYHRMNDEVALMADVAWTNWSQFKRLTVVRSNNAVASDKEENWQDAWFFSVGATYTPASLPSWRFNGGLAYDQSPVRDEFRTPRVPDNDRTWVSLGAAYSPTPNMDLTFGYTHIFVDKADINDTESGNGYSHTIQGSYDSHVDIVAIGATYRF